MGNVYNRKKLNNKGFTLIELLAVIVILAVVLGIVSVNVLGSAGTAKGESLKDSSEKVEQAFQLNYMNALTDNSISKMYSDVNGFSGYNFSDNYVGYLDISLADEFNMNTETYALGNASDALGATIDKSIVGYNLTTGKFVVCLVANKTGNYYVATNAVGNSENKSTVNKVMINGTNYTFADGVMFACNDGTKSW